MPPRDAYVANDSDVIRLMLRRIERLEEQLARVEARLAAAEASQG